MKFLPYAIGLICIPIAGLAYDYKIADLVIGHPIAHETIKSAMSGAGYFTVINNGGTDDRLIAIQADFPRVMMHGTTVTDGVAAMSHLTDGVVVPAGGAISFAPGGKHVMFMGLQGDPFEVGEKIPAVFSFENAGDISIDFNVEVMQNNHDH